MLNRWLLLCVTWQTAGAISCYNQTNMDVIVPDMGIVGLAEPSSGPLRSDDKYAPCQTQKWCARVIVDDGIVGQIPNVGSNIRMNGTLWTCIGTEPAVADCDRLGAGCHAVSRFSKFAGDIELCCCRGHMCNNDVSLSQLKASQQQQQYSGATTTTIAAGLLLAVAVLCVDWLR